MCNLRRQDILAQGRAKRKPTNEERDADEALRQFDEVLRRTGIEPGDYAHPLAAYPPGHLLFVLKHVALEDRDSSMKSFIETFFFMYGHGVSKQSINGWFRDSRKISRLQLARIVDLFARFIVDEPSTKLHGHMMNEAAKLCYFEEYPEDRTCFRVALEELCRSLFSLNGRDERLVLEAGIVASLSALDNDGLMALLATCSALGVEAGRAALDGIRGGEAMDGDRIQALLRLFGGAGASLSDLADWVDGATAPKDETPPDLPFDM